MVYPAQAQVARAKHPNGNNYYDHRFVHGFVFFYKIQFLVYGMEIVTIFGPVAWLSRKIIQEILYNLSAHLYIYYLIKIYE